MLARASVKRESGGARALTWTAPATVSAAQHATMLQVNQMPLKMFFGKAFHLCPPVWIPANTWSALPHRAAGSLLIYIGGVACRKRLSRYFVLIPRTARGHAEPFQSCLYYPVTFTVMAGYMVTVFSKPSCVQCSMTLRALDRQGISYQVLDVAQDSAAHARITSWGYRQVPVVLAGDEHWSGFRPDRIAAISQPA